MAPRLSWARRSEGSRTRTLAKRSAAASSSPPTCSISPGEEEERERDVGQTMKQWGNNLGKLTGLWVMVLGEK